MKLFATFDPSVSSELVDCESPPAASAVIVLRHAGGELGFERNDGPPLVQAFSMANGLRIVRENSPKWISSLDSREPTFSLSNIPPGVVAVEAPTAPLLEQLSISDANQKKRQANVILARHQRPLQALENSIFDHWVTSGRKVTCPAMQWLLQHSSLIGLWRHTDWGVHVVAYCLDADTLRERLKRFAALIGCELVEVESTARMPAW
jgi:hypothetical protein